jgi:hypothetical protein
MGIQANSQGKWRQNRRRQLGCLSARACASSRLVRVFYQ